MSNDKYALGFLGFAYYDQNRETLKAVGIKTSPDAKAVLPSTETIKTGTYQPLSRPIFIYIKKKSIENKKPVADFVNYYLTKSAPLIKDVGYVPLPENAYKLDQKRVAARTTGSVFGGEGSKIGVTVEQLLSDEKHDEKAAPAAGGDNAAGDKAADDAKKAADGAKDGAQKAADGAKDGADKAAKADAKKGAAE